jgi:3-oxoacyl-[acyl-carrier-protein] synthase III
MRVLGFGRTSGACLEWGSEMEDRLGMDRGHISKKVGVLARRTVAPFEDQPSIGCDAALQAMKAAGCAIGDIDLLISASSVPYQPIPSNAAILLSELGAKDGRTETFDINATCLSFLSALNVVDAILAAGSAQRVLVVSTETPSRAIDMEEDASTGAIFSDGAAAFIFERGTGFEMLSYRMRTYPTGRNHCQIAGGGTRYPALESPEKLVEEGVFRMHGERLMGLTARHLPGFLDDLLAQADIKREDLDLIIPHQASPHALKLMGRLCGLNQQLIVDTSPTRGNRVAASLPDTLIEAIRRGRIKPGGRILMLGTSAGVSFGGAVLELT